VSDISAEVRKRAGYRCEYCLIPQALFRRPFHIEHIIAKKHGGTTHLDNLALACWQCNLKKGPNLTGIDPESGEIARLFHPRRDTWAEHFAFHEVESKTGLIEILGSTPIGRATARLLDVNEEMRQILRYELSRSSAG
jgi:hypothetical protein